MIISVAGHKGGVGKTTIATSIATELHDRELRVLLVDTDLPQATTLSWSSTGLQNGETLPAVVGMKDNLAGHLRQVAANYDHVVIDCPPRTDRLQRAAMIVADLVLMPCGPSQFDVWALGDTLALFDEARSVREDLLGAILINKKDGRTKVGKTIRDPLRGHGVPVLVAEIRSRIAFAKAAAGGTSVTRNEPDGSAAEEVRAVVDEILMMTLNQEKAHVA